LINIALIYHIFIKLFYSLFEVIYVLTFAILKDIGFWEVKSNQSTSHWITVSFTQQFCVF